MQDQLNKQSEQQASELQAIKEKNVNYIIWLVEFISYLTIAGTIKWIQWTSKFSITRINRKESKLVSYIAKLLFRNLKILYQAEANKQNEAELQLKVKCVSFAVGMMKFVIELVLNTYSGDCYKYQASLNIAPCFLSFCRDQSLFLFKFIIFLFTCASMKYTYQAAN